MYDVGGIVAVILGEAASVSAPSSTVPNNSLHAQFCCFGSLSFAYFYNHCDAILLNVLSVDLFRLFFGMPSIHIRNIFDCGCFVAWLSADLGESVASISRFVAL